ncbi:MAG: transglycosylase domain-containing protein [Candidatus Marinimicrobia bacterium]|nr:transglycosylase domain-containing protein [Candidatus Neomarinimicrobiota bacterium]
MATFELKRLNYNLNSVRDILLFIEDRDFFKHPGFSIKAITRATMSMAKLRRRSGGSTITQQVSRTLFIHDIYKTYRRKIIEIMLAIWIEKRFDKNMILWIYIAAVRFEKGIYGIASAHKYFFGDNEVPPLKNSEAFFLIERVSNIASKVYVKKINDTLNQMLSNDILKKEDIQDIKKIYGLMVRVGKIKVEDQHLFDEWLME